MSGVKKNMIARGMIRDKKAFFSVTGGAKN
jgi:hypothetical protein